MFNFNIETKGTDFKNLLKKAGRDNPKAAASAGQSSGPLSPGCEAGIQGFLSAAG